MKPFFQAISGEAPSLHGSLPFDEAACAFRVQEHSASATIRNELLPFILKNKQRLITTIH
jgi:hypothetical protein